MTVRSRIEQHLAKLSNSERLIARLVIEKYPMSALGDIKDIAKLASVSPPTITRFVRRLGFERFVDFQRAVRLEVQDQPVDPAGELEQLAGQRLLEAVDARDAVTDLDDASRLLEVDLGLVALQLAFDDLADLFRLDHGSYPLARRSRMRASCPSRLPSAI